MIKIMEGGHFVKDGYSYKLYLTLPEFRSESTVNMHKNKHTVKKISFPTKFMLISNKIYVNIELRILGFGLGLEIQSKS